MGDLLGSDSALLASRGFSPSLVVEAKALINILV